jgi:hypothetical protein
MWIAFPRLEERPLRLAAFLHTTGHGVLTDNPLFTHPVTNYL